MSEPIRILHVLGRLDRGGAETMVMNLYRHVDRQVVQFDFILHTNQECGYSEEVKDLGGRIFSVPAYSVQTAAKYKRAWKCFFVKHPEYKILHSHIRSTASLYLPIARKHGLITIVHSHNTSSGSGISALVKNILQIPLRWQADYLLACSHRAGEWLFGKKSCSSPRFFILPNAIELKHFVYDLSLRKEVRHGLGCDESTLVAGHVGRFETQKNHRFLLEVFSLICKHKPDSMLLLIGEGPLEKNIREYAGRLHILDKVRFLGKRSDVNLLLQGMDVFLFPSLYEGLPVTLIEAQSSGLPIIMSETVTEEVRLTNCVYELPLQDSHSRKGISETRSAEKWAELALNLPISGRRDYIVELKAAGYDIRDTAAWLTQFYQRLLN